MMKILFLCLLLSVKCYSAGHHLLSTPSDFQPISNYQTFEEYTQKVKQSLSEHRYFLTDNHQQEIEANLPFELKPLIKKEETSGILLIHGLGDSPYSFTDIAQSLAKRGFLTRTILLSGHGTRPGDMLNADYEEWKETIDKQVQLLKAEVDNVYLGGFSTGGNLAFMYAVEDPDIKGLALFSPGFAAKDWRLPYAQYAYYLCGSWLEGKPTSVTEDNYVRYMTLPVNGYTQYYYTTLEVSSGLKKYFDRPVFVVLSENDSILSVYKIRELFTAHFVCPDSHLMWFGSEEAQTRERVTTINSYQPEYRISNMSHMGVLFSPENPYYGVNGKHRIWQNGQSAEVEQACKAAKTEDIWYSAWGHKTEDGKVHARTTFNPAFDLMMNKLFEVFKF